MLQTMGGGRGHLSIQLVTGLHIHTWKRGAINHFLLRNSVTCLAQDPRHVNRHDFSVSAAVNSTRYPVALFTKVSQSHYRTGQAQGASGS
jgi:hypothetical protein